MLEENCSCVLVQDESQLKSECSTNTFPTILHKLNEMRMGGVVCDVFFKVGREERRFTAHRLILAATSDVFYASFFGALASKDGCTEQTSTYIPDVYPDAFELVLQYCYFIYSEVAVELVVHALYAAEKYNIKLLKAACLERLMNIDFKDAVIILNQAVGYNESTIIRKCLKIIDEKSDEVIFSKSLRDCDRNTLELIISRETFTPTNQFALFKEIFEFAKKQCKEKSFVPNIQSAKEILADILSSIKSFTLSLEDVDEAVKLGVMTKNEIDRLIHNEDLKTSTAPHAECPTLYSLRRTTDLVKVEWLKLSTALLFKTNLSIRIWCIGIYSSCDNMELRDISLMFAKYGEYTQKMNISKVHSEGNIVYIHVQDGIEVEADIEYQFFVNFTAWEGKEFFYNKTHLTTSSLTTCDGKTLVFTCTDRSGNGFYPEIRFSFQLDS